MDVTRFAAGTAMGRLGAAGGLALLLAACGGSSTAAKATAPRSDPATSAPAASAAPGGTGTPVQVIETEFAIELPQKSFPPGTYTFTVLDKGHATHALEIDGPGVNDKVSSSLSGGQSTSLTVTLQKGTYRLYCPVGNHASLGMDTEITVT